jgi:hypothetical protein
VTTLSEEYIAGATAEAEARNEGLSKAARSVRDCAEGLARLPGFADADEEELVEALARIFLSRRVRWRLAWRSLRKLRSRW